MKHSKLAAIDALIGEVAFDGAQLITRDWLFGASVKTLLAKGLHRRLAVSLGTPLLLAG